MSMRSTAEIAAEVRSKAAIAIDADLAYHSGDCVIDRRFYREVIAVCNRLAEVDAEVLDQARHWSDAFAALDALRLPCPTCGGTKFKGCLCGLPGLTVKHVADCGTHRPCPDCPDGRMSHERAWKIVAAVFDDTPILPSTVPSRYRDHLRGIR